MQNPYAGYTLEQLKERIAELKYQLDSWDSYAIMDDEDMNKEDLSAEYNRVVQEKRKRYEHYIRFKNYMKKANISIGKEGWLFGRSDSKKIKEVIKAFEKSSSLVVQTKTKRDGQEDFLYLVGVFEE